MRPVRSPRDCVRCPALSFQDEISSSTDTVSARFRLAMDIKAYMRTPKGLQDQWTFTPSLVDSDFLAFTSIANQPSPSYAATPGSMGMLYRNQAGDPMTTDAAPAAHSAIDITQFQHPFVSHQGYSVDP